MGLFQQACKTYEAHRQQVGKYIVGEEPLAPISHLLTKAQVEITLNAKGEFDSGSKVEAEKSKDKTQNSGDKESKIIIPVTIESANRTSGVCAHPLCEQLKYLAPYDQERYDAYVKQLSAWIDWLESENCPLEPATKKNAKQKLQAVLAYVKGQTILKDLQESSLIKLDSKGLPDNDKTLVRWKIVGLESLESCCWKDRDLFSAWEKYYESLLLQKGQPQGLCMIEGTETVLTTHHPKGVVAVHGNAKLISSNDSVNFTYRGRFTKPEQANTISYRASQESHNALRWVIANQGITLGGNKDTRTFVCWEPLGAKLPRPINPLIQRPPEKDSERITPSNYQGKLRKKLNGYRNSLDSLTTAVIAAFASSTTGRLTVTYYRELQASDFLERLYNWDRLCCWPNGKFGVQSPYLAEIVCCAYGTPKENSFECDERLLCQQVQALLACRLDGAPLPYTLVHQLVTRASNPQAYKDSLLLKLQFVACACLRKFYYDKYKEEWPMSLEPQLEPQRLDRSYQYGRILAILEKAERDTYDKEKREPNAIRLQSVFAQRPLYAMKFILERVKQAYYPRLNPSTRQYYERLLGEIMETLSECPEAEREKALKETYLFGYYLQKKALYTKKTETTEDEE